jgi:hypothetical protein
VNRTQINAELKKGSSIVGRHTYTIKKSVLTHVRNVGLIAGSIYLTSKYKSIGLGIAVGIAQYALSVGSVKHDLKVYVIDIKNANGGISTVVQKFKWV